LENINKFCQDKKQARIILFFFVINKLRGLKKSNGRTFGLKREEVGGGQKNYMMRN
jgi:hypothetical protein